MQLGSVWSIVPALHDTVTPVCKVYPLSHVNVHVVESSTLVPEAQFDDISGALNVGTVHGSAKKTKYHNE